eukprot:TRINITY_DN135_c0_g1_i1.p1 TRINITY_DN135_c0_g1~~TRINITY_DN135_c0_g1_i1.p1  ORF type:complete len:302 (-),score=105.91 TRINITY_DN135_c0_g1_i1:63-968(-)
MTTVLDEMTLQGQIDAVYSMCLTDQGGMWDLGVVDEVKFAPYSLTYLPLIDSTYYVVQTRSLKMTGFGSWNTTALSVTGYPAIFDSGTTLLLMPDAVFTSIMSALYLADPPLPGLNTLFNGGCMNITADQLNQWPTLSFGFLNVDGSTSFISVPPTQYFLKIVNNGTVCYASGVSTSGGYNGFILGDVFLQSSYVVYDKANGRLGYAPVTNCLHSYVPGGGSGTGGTGGSSGTGGNHHDDDDDGGKKGPRWTTVIAGFVALFVGGLLLGALFMRCYKRPRAEEPVLVVDTQRSANYVAMRD